MNIQIMSTTDRKYIGRKVVLSDGTVHLEPGVKIKVHTIMETENCVRLSSSNYVIDARKLGD